MTLGKGKIFTAVLQLAKSILESTLAILSHILATSLCCFCFCAMNSSSEMANWRERRVSPIIVTPERPTERSEVPERQRSKLSAMERQPSQQLSMPDPWSPKSPKNPPAEMCAARMTAIAMERQVSGLSQLPNLPALKQPLKIDLLRAEFRQIGYIRLAEQKFAARVPCWNCCYSYVETSCLDPLIWLSPLPTTTFPLYPVSRCDSTSDENRKNTQTDARIEFVYVCLSWGSTIHNFLAFRLTPWTSRLF